MGPVKFQISKREYVFLATLNLWCRKKMVFYLSLLIVLLIISWSVKAPTYSCVVGLIVVFICLPLSTVCHFNKIVKSNPDLYIYENILSADNDGIKINSVSSSSYTDWFEFKKWTENSKYIFLHYARSRPMFIPKRAFTSEQLAEFKTLLCKNIWPFPGKPRTTDEYYARRAMTLAVTSFFLANSFLIIPFCSIPFILIGKFDSYRYIFGILMLLCLLTSLPMAIIAYKRGKRMNGNIAQINITRIFSLLAILSSLFWIMMWIIAPFISRHGPGW